MIAVFSCDEGPRERGPFFMLTKLKNLYTISCVCIAKPHFLYKLPYLRKKKFTFFIKMFCALNI